MKVQSFQAFKQLTEKGILATMRNYPYNVLQRVLINGGIDGEGLILGRYENNTENRSKLLSISGFSSLEEWEEEAIRLHGKLPRYIVVVLYEV